MPGSYGSPSNSSGLTAFFRERRFAEHVEHPLVVFIGPGAAHHQTDG